jgi:Zn-dependent protease
MRMAQAGIITNLVIFAFNLFPVPPLDGGRIMFSLLPHRLAWRYAQLEPYGFFIVMGLAFLKVLNYWMVPVMTAANAALAVAISPLTFLLS